ncbi:MAG: hypothetical protein Q4G68_09500 [Planctomycetia bacterium]|nr:hypothetical protein [Planctomycetia bacterium]
MRSIFLTSVLSVLSVFYATTAFADDTSPLKLETKSFRYEISQNGQNLALIDLATGTDYLASSPEGGPCATIEKDGQTVPCSQAALKDNRLTLAFGSSDVTATLDVQPREWSLALTVTEVTGDPDTLTFLSIPLTLHAKPDETFAACALSQNLTTHVHELPALMSQLVAHAYKRFGIVGAKASIVAAPMTDILVAIQESLQRDADFPISDQGGAWAAGAREGYGSYMMNFGSLTEKTVDDWIADCKNFGFDQIDNHGGSRGFFTFGSFDINPDLFPEGWNSFKKIVDRLHEAGISSIFHTYTMYISGDSSYVTPKPHPDLDVFARFTLAEPVTADATELVVQESTADVSLETGYVYCTNNVLRIGDELIRYSDVTREAPFKFTGCTRGLHGTEVAPHAAGASANILRTFWGGLYIPDPNSELFDEIARRTAEIVDQVGFDGIYFDAIEGVRSMWGEENYWYYGDKFVFEVMKNLKKPVGLEYAGMVHHWWHYRSRYQAWDSPNKGYKRFMDIHIASMKAGEEYQHGCWSGHLPQIQRYGSMKGSSLFLPLQLGWWNMLTWGGPKRDPLYCDDMEYVCCKMIGNNAGLSTNCNLSRALLDQTPAFARLATMIRRYEELRHANYFDASICEKLRQVGDEFTLVPDANNTWSFKPVKYEPHVTAGLDSDSARWTVSNAFDPQQIKFRLEVLTSANSYDDPEATMLLDPNDPQLTVVRAADGLAGTVTQSETNLTPTGEKTIQITATNQGQTPRDEAWLEMNHDMTPTMDLSEKQALGVWVFGDAGGEVLDFRIWSSAGFEVAKSSHLVKVDFSGWRYFELVEADSTQMSEYAWPGIGGYYVYDQYRGSANYGAAAALQIWLNNVPAGHETRVQLGPVMALPTKAGKVENPLLTINGKELQLPVTMETGMYLELGTKGTNEPFAAGEDWDAISQNDRPYCRLFTPGGQLAAEIPLDGELPLFQHGVNELTLSGTSVTGPVRLRTTLITTGSPLK